MTSDKSILNQYESLLNAIKEITGSSDCSIFLLDWTLNMDEEEKKEVFDDRIRNIRENIGPDHPAFKYIEDLDRNDTDRYSILTYFVGTEENWRLKKENYKKRPHKYVVFDKAEEDSIPKEGMTAFCARTGKSTVIVSRNMVKSHPSFSGMNEGENLVHDSCAQVAAHPITKQDENGERCVIGVIRCDIYDPDRAPVFSNETLEELKRINNVLCRILLLGREDEEAASYDRLFHGVRLLDSLKAISGSLVDGADRDVYLITKKLLYVLVRRRYFGYRAIMARVRGYICDVCDLLSLDNEPVKSLLDNFSRHEDLVLYSNANYRDHFMHQFHVFVSGYIVLHFVGVDKITKILNDNYMLGRGRRLSDVNTLRIWFLASFFHDNCYILTDFDSNISRFLTDILQYPTNKDKREEDPERFKFKVDLRWGQLGEKESGFLEEITSIAAYLVQEGRNADHVKLCAEVFRAMTQRDHGVLSALVMLQTMSQADKLGDVNYGVEKSIASAAISLHTSTMFSHAKSQMGNSDKDCFFHFEMSPIKFLLSYCDFAQEWGRRRQDPELQRWGPPTLHSLGFNQEEKKILCNLVYSPATRYSHRQATPEDDLLKDWAKDILSTFRSINFNFCIRYYEHSKRYPSPEELMETSPIYEVSLKDSSQRKGLRKKCPPYLLHHRSFHFSKQ